jgi:hypothetical protein
MRPRHVTNCENRAKFGIQSHLFTSLLVIQPKAAPETGSAPAEAEAL